MTMALNQSTIFGYGAVLLCFLALAGALLQGGAGTNPLVLLFTVAGCAMSDLAFKFGYIVIPLITRLAGITVKTETGYEIPPSQDVMLRKGESGTFFASIFMGIRIYESASDKSMEQIAYNEYFERAVSNIKFVTKISYMLYVEDVAGKRKDIETRKAEAQLRLAREKDKPEPDVLKLDRYEREVSKWDNELNKLIKGIKPMGAVAYAMTTGTGITKEAAIATARSQANELKAVLTNALNVEIDVLTGDEMLKAFEWEKAIPSLGQELEDMVA
ncbi:Uncharacterised protein [uncultured archaeon]|nr:Uncharacterised protein [uncultured archaeon]